MKEIFSETLMFHRGCVKEASDSRDSRFSNRGEELFTVTWTHRVDTWFVHGFSILFTRQILLSFKGLTEQTSFAFIFIHLWFHFISESDLKWSELKSLSPFFIPTWQNCIRDTLCFRSKAESHCMIKCQVTLKVMVTSGQKKAFHWLVESS